MVVVSRNAPVLYEYLADQLATDPTFSVVVDRRVSEQRHPETNTTGERRRTDRRDSRDIRAQLDAAGFVIIPPSVRRD